MLNIRDETSADFPHVHAITTAAFKRHIEADINDRLRAANAAVISLVAERNAAIVGHIMFSRAAIVDNGKAQPTVALGPIAIDPAHQRRGYGGKLIQAGLQACKDKDIPHVFLLGHTTYYPRFGFQPAANYGVIYGDKAHDAFMCLELTSGSLDTVAGRMVFHQAFNGS